MIVSALLLVSASALASPCSADAGGFCTDRVVRYSLSYDQPDPVARVNVALGKSLVVELASPNMELTGEPVLGNKRILETKMEASRILVWAKTPPGAGDIIDIDMIGHKTNLQLDFFGGIHLLLEVRIGDEREAVERLVLDFPERQQESEYVRKTLAEQEHALRADYESKSNKLDEASERRAKRSVARALLNRLQCRDISAREMHDLVVVRSRRVCRVGDQVHIWFSIQNRARAMFALHSVKVIAGDGDSAGPVDDALVEYEQEHGILLGYDGEIRGIATVAVPADSPQANRYGLLVTEDGGQGRVIKLKDVGL